MPFTVTKTAIPGVLELEPKVFGDERGFFLESFNRRDFRAATGVDAEFVQDNHSRSSRGVLRGLHYQVRHAQGKLVRATIGEVFDVAVDLRRGSPTLGSWVGSLLTAENQRQIWIPPGFAHGFLVLSETADVEYKVTDYRYPEEERAIRWDDGEIGIEWPLVAGTKPMLVRRDAEAGGFDAAELFG